MVELGGDFCCCVAAAAGRLITAASRVITLKRRRMPSVVSGPSIDIRLPLTLACQSLNSSSIAPVAANTDSTSFLRNRF